MRKIFVSAIVFIVVAIACGGLYYFNYGKEVKFRVLYTVDSKEVNSNSVFVFVPDGNYDELFSAEFGKEEWRQAKELFRQKAGLKKFMRGDVFSMTKSNRKVREFALHHYKNNSEGEKIFFRRTGIKYVKHTAPITLERNTVVQHFRIKNSFEKDFPGFYDWAKTNLLWDWALLDKMQPNDEASFLVRGVFEKDILVSPQQILGFTMKGANIGEVTMTLYRDQNFGSYFISGNSDMYISPPEFFRVPIDYGRVTSLFAKRTDPFSKRNRMHKGIDIIARKYENIHAAKDGKVTFAGWKRGFGNTVMIDHGNGIKTLYGHLSELYVKSGMDIRMGDILGGAGSTGRSTSTHLHFAVYKDGVAVDPMKYKYERVLIAPFEIAGRFKAASEKKIMALQDSMRTKETFFVKLRLAKADLSTHDF